MSLACNLISTLYQQHQFYKVSSYWLYEMISTQQLIDLLKWCNTITFNILFNIGPFCGSNLNWTQREKQILIPGGTLIQSHVQHQLWSTFKVSQNQFCSNFLPKIKILGKIIFRRFWKWIKINFKGIFSTRNVLFHILYWIKVYNSG